MGRVYRLVFVALQMQKPGTWCTRAEVLEADDEPGSGQATIHFDFASDVVLSFLVLRVTSTVPLYRLLLVVQESLRPFGGEQKANSKHLGPRLLGSSQCRTFAYLAKRDKSNHVTTACPSQDDTHIRLHDSITRTYCLVHWAKSIAKVPKNRTSRRVR
jgi:hypothetical protein